MTELSGAGVPKWDVRVAPNLLGLCQHQLARWSMSSNWHPESDATPTTGEVDLMAAVLEGRHGVHAELVAQFFTDWNAQKGDASRSWAWAAVAGKVRQRMTDRISSRSIEC